ncbi:helix-turn-helix protein [delta proteobacterium NaphS2]|nr:helix-turn-helix protein [delta proteobacterium NaphS2]
MSYTIRQIRENLIGYQMTSAARYAGISVERLTEIENGAEPSFYEIEALSRIYGIDSETLDQVQIDLKAGDSVTVLASQEEYEDLDDAIRLRVVEAANAAKDLLTLRAIIGDQVSGFETQSEFPTAANPPEPWAQGKEIARVLRKKLALGTSEIASMRDLVINDFPEISLLYARLGREGPAGITFADDLRGQCIVINLDGKNVNPCVRRFSIAHELCHILYDWNRTEPLALVSGYREKLGLEREKRANSFAVRFLCPESNLTDSQDPLDLIKRLTGQFGIHYGAARLYILNKLGKELPIQPPPDLRDFSVHPRWTAAEEPLGINGFPLPSVPSQRRTMIAEFSGRLYSQGQIRRDRFAEFLGVTPAEEVEVVLDFLGLDLPVAA